MQKKPQKIPAKAVVVTEQHRGSYSDMQNYVLFETATEALGIVSFDHQTQKLMTKPGLQLLYISCCSYGMSMSPNAKIAYDNVGTEIKARSV